MPQYNDALSQYIIETFISGRHALQETLQNSQVENLPSIHIKPEEGQFLKFLVRACNAVKAIEIGTLGGYSAQWIIQGLSDQGKLITLEKDPHHAAVARQNFDKAGIGERVEIRIGNAHDLLEKLSSEGPFDFVMIDAEKTGYPKYLDWALRNIRLGGIIVAHNAFRHGKVLDKQSEEAETRAIQEYNRRVANDPRLISTIFPAGDGMVISLKID